jgi:Protein of unknown function (DUF1559)
MTLERINVVLVIILVLLVSGLGLPVILRVQRAANRTTTMNNLKIVGLAMHSYNDGLKQLPPAFDRTPMRAEFTGESVHYPVSVHVHLLPYVDQRAVFRTFLIEGKGNAGVVVPAFISLEDGSHGSQEGVQNFAANLRLFSDKGGKTPSAKDMPALAKVEPGSRRLIGITHGTSNTIAFATKLAACGEGGSRYAADPTSDFAAFFGQIAARTTAQYANPQSTFQWAPRGDECLCRPLMAQNYLPQSLLAGFADATVRRLPGDMDPGLWNAYLHPTGE